MRKTPDQPSQTLVASAPQPIQFATPDSGQRILGVLRAEYEKTVTHVLQQDRLAEERRMEREQLERTIQKARERHSQVEAEERAARSEADSGRNVVKDAAAMLAQGGVAVSPEVEPVHLAPLATSQGDVNGHASQFGGPPPSFPDDPADGYCIHCGKAAWRKPASPHHPKGATHSFGATCNPDAEEPTYADLGPVRAEADR
jgi:hypothetical protein